MVHGGGHHGGGGGVGRSSGVGSSITRHNHGSGHHNRRHINFSRNQQRHGRRHQYQHPTWWGGGNNNNYATPGNVVIINQPSSSRRNPPAMYPYYSTGGSRRVRHADDDDCCASCCNMCCQALCIGMVCHACCGNNRSASSETTSDGDGAPPAASFRRGPKNPHYCLWTFLSIFLFIILCIASSMNEHWTLNAGETRRVQPSFLTKAVTIESTSSSSSSSGVPVDLSIYDIPSGKCPPLTGPVVNLKDSHTLSLGADDYHYDYFYLNAGSVINLRVTQQNNVGSTRIYIFKGKDKLDELENGSDDNDEYDFGRNALVNKYISGKGATANLTYRVKKSDVFILVYDNASSSRQSTIAVDYQVALTSFDLSHQTPVCQDAAPWQECTVENPSSVPFVDKGCIIVQARGGNNSGGSSEDIVDVKLTGERAWISILFCSSIPLLFGLLLAQCRQHCCNHSDESNHNPETGGYEPVVGGSNPPPTAPQAYSALDEEANPPAEAPPQPSAPPEPFTDLPPATAPPSEEPSFAAATVPFAEAQVIDEDIGSIPIVSAENVVPIPPTGK